MDFKDLVVLYEKKRSRFGEAAYKHVSELLRQAKELHKQDWLKHPTARRDREQSWRAFKGKSLEKLVQYIIAEKLRDLD